MERLESYINQLISFASTDDNHGELKKCAAWIENELKSHVHPERVRIEIVHKDHIPSVLAVQGDWKNPDILLNGHFDVVPGHDEQYTPQKDGDKIYGRGAADMKASVASLMIAFMETVNAYPDLSIGLMLTGDEEMGGARGVEYLVNEGWKTNLLVCFDGGFGETISHAEKGILRLRFSSKGKRAKVNNPWDGVSALESVIEIYHILEDLFPDYKKATAEDNWYSTFTPRAVHTKPNGNCVISHADFDVSIHFTEDIGAEKLIEKIKMRIPKNTTVEASIVVERVFVEKDNPEILHFKKCFEKELNKKVPIKGENGSSDARFFVPQNIPMILTKPKSGNPEADGEWVSLDSTQKLTNALIAFLAEKAKG